MMMEGEGLAICDAAIFQDIFNGIEDFAVTRVCYRCNRMGGSLIGYEVFGEASLERFLTGRFQDFLWNFS
jgi:hypothetical protein